MADTRPESSPTPPGNHQPMAAGADVAGQVPRQRGSASPGSRRDRKKSSPRPAPGGIGICVSGAGIRSAAFALGGLQVLQHHRILKSASYLAAVSGGSYIAAAMALVTKGEIPSGSGHGPRFVKPGTDLPAFSRNSPEEQYLRNNLRYLTHGPGGSLGVAGRVMFCLLLNLLFFAGCLWVVAVPLGWAYGAAWTGLQNSAPCGRSPSAGCIIHVHLDPLIWTIVVGLAIAGGIAGLVWAGVAWRTPAKRQAVGALAGVLLGLAAAVLIVGIGVPYLLAFLRGTVATIPAQPHATVNQGVAARRSSVPLLVGAGVGLAGSIASILGWVSALTQKITPEEKTIISWLRRFVQNHRALTINALAALAGPLLTLMLALLAINFGASHIPGWHSKELVHLLFLVVPLVVLVGLYFLADLNSWSLHPYFRQHLSQAFALGRVLVSPPAARPRGAGSRPRRWFKLTPAPSTSRIPIATESMAGITLSRPGPNVPAGGGGQPERSATVVQTSAGELQDARQRPYESPYLLSESLASDGDFPCVLICAAANVNDYGKVPTGCNATSFVFSHEKIGGPTVGDCEMGVYEKAISSRPITVPGVLAIAGAGISPEMNRLTHWPLRYLMTIANVRFGVWLPNPYVVANQFEDLSDKIRKWCWVHLLRKKEEALVYRRPSARYLFRELLGRNHLDSHFVYVTDGRHYESLGLVELIRRQCSWIYCIDGTDDTNSFDAIGHAIALAKAEEEADIQLDPREQMGAEDGGPHVYGRPDRPFARSVVAEGTVTYRDDIGTAKLIVVKAAVTKDAPWDIRSWQERHADFPRDPAFGQFSAEQFDAYRALGEYAMTQAMAKGCPPLPGDVKVAADLRPDGMEQQVARPGTPAGTEMV